MEKDSDRIARLETFAALDPNNPTLLFDLAQAQHKSGNQERTLELCERLIELQGESARSANLAGSAHLARGRWNEAAAAFARAVQLDPTAPPLHFNLAYAEYARTATWRRD